MWLAGSYHSTRQALTAAREAVGLSESVVGLTQVAHTRARNMSAWHCNLMAAIFARQTAPMSNVTISSTRTTTAWLSTTCRGRPQTAGAFLCRSRPQTPGALRRHLTQTVGLPPKYGSRAGSKQSARQRAPWASRHVTRDTSTSKT